MLPPTLYCVNGDIVLVYKLLYFRILQAMMKKKTWKSDYVKRHCNPWKKATKDEKTMTVRMIATQAIRLLFGMLKLPRADTNSCAIFITNLKLPTPAACIFITIRRRCPTTYHSGLKMEKLCRGFPKLHFFQILAHSNL